MRLRIALLLLLCASASTVSGEDRGWKDGGPWLGMDSGQMVGTDRLHTPNPDVAETVSIALNATCSESLDRQQVLCYFTQLSVLSLPGTKDCAAEVTVEQRTLRVIERSTSRVVWSGSYDGHQAQRYYRLTVTFNPKN